MLWKRKTIVFALVLALALIVSVANADYMFGTPLNLGPTVNSLSVDAMPCLSADGLSLYFNSNRPIDGLVSYDLWVTTRTAVSDPWDPPVNLGPIVNSSYNDGTPSLSANGLELYFSSDRSEQGKNDLWVTRRDTVFEPWGTPVNLGPTVNSSYIDWSPSISADGLELFLHSDRPSANGGDELWVARRETTNHDWESPVNLGPTVNSLSLDATPSISADGLLLFFQSNRPGYGGYLDIWLARRATKDDPWQEPKNLGPPLNSSSWQGNPCISADGSTLYFVTNRLGSAGLDLWQVSIEPVVDLNGDGDVDAQDMSILIDHWHTSDPLCDIGPTPMGDGIVDIQDMTVLSEYLEPGFGRIAHWKLDETEGRVAYDSIGSDHANVHGEAVWQPDAGQMAGALEFDGVDDYVAPMCILNPVDGPFRISAWIKGGAPGQIIASQTPFEFQLGGVYLAADATDGALATEAILPIPLKSDVVITDGEWHQVGLEWDGDYRHLIVDDNEVAVDNIDLLGLENTGYLNIGTGKELEADTFWSGLIDDVRVYEKGETP